MDGRPPGVVEAEVRLLPLLDRLELERPLRVARREEDVLFRSLLSFLAYSSSFVVWSARGCEEGAGSAA